MGLEGKYCDAFAEIIEKPSFRHTTPNTAILSELLLYKKKRKDFDGANQLKNISPVAWQHINFYGRYEFNKKPIAIDIEALIQEIEGNY